MAKILKVQELDVHLLGEGASISGTTAAGDAGNCANHLGNCPNKIGRAGSVEEGAAAGAELELTLDGEGRQLPLLGGASICESLVVEGIEGKLIVQISFVHSRISKGSYRNGSKWCVLRNVHVSAVHSEYLGDVLTELWSCKGTS